VVWGYGTAVCVTVGWRLTHGGELALVAGQAGSPTEGQVLCHHVGVQCLMRACFVTPMCMEHTGMRRMGSGDRCVRHGGVETDTWVGVGSGGWAGGGYPQGRRCCVTMSGCSGRCVLVL
jgi:hypothetical protein